MSISNIIIYDLDLLRDFENMMLKAVVACIYDHVSSTNIWLPMELITWDGKWYLSLLYFLTLN